MELLEKLEFYKKNKKMLKSEILEKIEKAFDIDYTYNSTTIEGNTLTLIETKAVLEDKISIGGKQLREIYEVINHNKAFQYLKETTQEEELEEKKIKKVLTKREQTWYYIKVACQAQRTRTLITKQCKTLKIQRGKQC